MAYTDTSCGAGNACVGGVCVAQICTPGQTHCKNDQNTELCNANGAAYDPGTACPANQQCCGTQGCIPLCDLPTNTSSAAGCSFFALNMDNLGEGHADAVSVANTNPTLDAVVNLHSSYGGLVALLQGNVTIPPLGTYVFNLPNAATDVIHGISGLRTGGSFRVESAVPLAACLDSPLTPYYTNDASCLLPETQLGTHYTIADQPVTVGAHVVTSTSAFGVMAVGYTSATSYGYPGGMGLGPQN